jgi:hypothetical protein
MEINPNVCFNLVDAARSPARYFNIVMRIMIMTITITHSKR